MGVWILNNKNIINSDEEISIKLKFNSFKYSTIIKNKPRNKIAIDLCKEGNKEFSLINL